MKALLLKNKFFILGEFLLIVYLLHYITNGENSYITIHDFLDSNLVNMSILKNNNAIFDFNKIIPIFGEMPRNWLAIPYDLRLILFSIFSPYWYIVINIFLIKTCAFGGLYIFLKSYIVQNNKYATLISASVGFAFALVPFYIDYGISSAGIPLLLYALFNLYYKRNLTTSFLTICFYGIYSMLTLCGVFVCFLLFSYILYHLYSKKQIQIYLLAGLITLSTIYILVNINIFYEFLFPHFVSHRNEFSISTSIKETLLIFLSIFKYSQYHAGLFFSTPIIITMLILWYFKRKNDKTLRRAFLSFILLSGLILLGFLLPYIFSNIQFFEAFRFERFFFLFPSLCFIILGIIIDRFVLYHKTIIAVLLWGITASSCIYCDGEFRVYRSSFTNHSTAIDNHSHPSFAQFYDEDLFDKIEKKISPKSRFDYKIVCLGFYPAIAQYNQFKTIDAYFFSYPLEYKHKFREIISPELNKSETIRTYFDQWGSRCYLFSSELGKNYMFSKNSDVVIKNLELNMDALKEFGASFIFSSVEISNYKDLNLNLIDSFTTDASYWKIWVYKIM